MKKGDKVICINDSGWTADAIRLIPNRPVYMTIYTIRDVALTRQGKAILLEEITNKPVMHPSGMGVFEPNFNKNRFVKVEDSLDALEDASKIKQTA